MPQPLNRPSYYQRNRARIRARANAKNAADRAAHRLAQKLWRIAHPKHVRKYNLRAFYGISPEEVPRLRKLQKNKCKICQVRFNGKVWTRKPNVDHCHRTKVVRGLLCTNCNKALGLFKDSLPRLKNAVKYLGGNLPKKVVKRSKTGWTKRTATAKKY